MCICSNVPTCNVRWCYSCILIYCTYIRPKLNVSKMLHFHIFCYHPSFLLPSKFVDTIQICCYHPNLLLSSKFVVIIQIFCNAQILFTVQILLTVQILFWLSKLLLNVQKFFWPSKVYNSLGKSPPKNVYRICSYVSTYLR